MPQNLLTIREVADLLKINEKTVYKLVAAAKIPGIKVGGSWRFDRTALSTWIKSKSAPDMAASSSDADAEPEWGDRAYEKRLHDYYGAEPYWGM